jgi:N-acetylmuramic acid 6-phosphate etherase
VYVSRPAPPITEAPNARTRDLDQLSTAELLGRILDEDEAVAAVVRQALPAIQAACDALTLALAEGGRWFNLGAGTSGRIGALDAAEIPPTFGLAPDRVQAVIAGGEAALVRAVEGAEDDAEAAVRELRARGFGPRDALLALSASGRTPYALRACAHARSLGARSIGVTCAPGSELERAVDIAIVTPVGPEVIAGSTRMKGGLAQKMILHALSTAVMVKLGRVRGNLMTGVQPHSAKLRERALRIVAQLGGCSREQAERALAAAGGSVEVALEQLGASRARD